MQRDLARFVVDEVLSRPDVAEALVALDELTKPKRGPQPGTSWFTVVGGYICTSLQGIQANAVTAARTLRGASDADQALLGIIGKPPTKHQIRHRLQRLDQVLRKLPDLESALAKLHPILDTLTEASAGTFDGEGVLALDTTLVDANTPRLKGEEIAAVRDRKQRTALDESRKRVLRRVAGLPDKTLTKFVDTDAVWKVIEKSTGPVNKLGYQVVAIGTPALEKKAKDKERVVRLRVIPNSANDAPVAAAMVLDLQRAGADIERLLADRGFSDKTDSFLNTLRDAGIPLTFDLKAKDQGIAGTFKGALIIDGWLYSPACPSKLRNLIRPGVNASEEEKERYDKAVAEREIYAFRRHGTLDTDPRSARAVRLESPVLRQTSKGPGVRCPSVPASMKHPNPKLKTCRAGCKPGQGCALPRGVVWRADAAPRQWQGQPFGTEQWKKSYNPRSGIERLFGRVKGETGVRFTKHGTPRGIIRFTFAVTMATAAMNLMPRWHALID